MSTEPLRLDPDLVARLAAAIDGELVRPDDPAYDDARSVWNAMVDRHPALVVRPVGTNDVVEAVRFARRHDLPLAVRGGGHNVAGHGVCDDGLVIDCAPLNHVAVDADARTVRVGSGALLGDLDEATTAHGLVTPGGIISHTGVAGLTLGGGWGWLSRSYGLTVDNLRAVELVTAAGRVLRASDRDHPDLFWALRGGGGNFGVVTEFAFDLHRLDREVLAGVVVYPLDVARDLLRFHREFTVDAPRELCCYASVRTAPDVDLLPPEVRGTPVATVYLCYAGDVEAGERVIEPLRAFGTPLVDTVEPRPYLEFQRLFDDVYPAGFRNYWKSGFVGPDGLSDDAIDTLVDRASDLPSPYTSIVVEHLGGAISDVPADATAYPHRDAGYSFNVFARWVASDDDEAQIAWARALFDAMTPLLDDGVYVNFLSREGDARVRAAFGDNYARLARVKARYDPENAFSANQNVTPTRVTE